MSKNPGASSGEAILPVIDLSPLTSTSDARLIDSLIQSLRQTFSTTGFAYLANPPLSLSEDGVFSLARTFFSLPQEVKDSIAKHSFKKENRNTYRGYFPTQPERRENTLKEGLEIGPPHAVSRGSRSLPSDIPDSTVDLTEGNVWPDDLDIHMRTRLEQLWLEMQNLAARLLSLLAVGLGQETNFFDYMPDQSVSTLRLLRYPPIADSMTHAEVVKEYGDAGFDEGPSTTRKLVCAPHTDSSILTLLFQDQIGGLEVLLPSSETSQSEVWVSAPHIPNTLVCNVGDLMARLSGGEYRATVHRVCGSVPSKASQRSSNDMGRLSVPFFFEPGIESIIRPVSTPLEAISSLPSSLTRGEISGNEDSIDGRVVVYGTHVLQKMRGFVEFADALSEKAAAVEVTEVVEEVVF